MINLQKKKQTGFTLLELIVVISLLGLVTSLASDFVINETNQQRLNTTKQRMEQIRYAIIGDSSRSLNGQPTISGFIADTGKVPVSIRQLLSDKGYCEDQSKHDKSACDSDGKTWIPGVALWKGPYLQPTGYKTIKDVCDSTGVPAESVPVYRDGWGNVDKDSADCTLQPHANFGWNFSQGIDNTIPSTPKLADINLQSYGLGGADMQDDVDEQYFPSGSIDDSALVGVNEFSIGEKQITLDFDSTIIIQEFKVRDPLGDSNFSPITVVSGTTKTYKMPANTIIHSAKIQYSVSGAPSTIIAKEIFIDKISQGARIP
jgi:prepilin-type N-terminal cleavage/methylation domain-containing protein